GQAVDDIGVVAKPTYHRVHTALAVQHVVAVVAADEVAKTAADAVDVAGADERQVLQLRLERVGKNALDLVAAAVAGDLDYLVRRGIHAVEVPARATRHGVAARTAVDRVVVRITDDAVRLLV